MSDIFDTVMNFAEKSEKFRPVPPGRYLAQITGYKPAENPNTGNKGVEVEFALKAAVDGQDLEGVNLARARVTHTLWITEKSLGIVMDEFFRPVFAELATEKMPLRDLVDNMVSRNIIVGLTSETKDRRTGAALKYPRLRVQTFEKA